MSSTNVGSIHYDLKLDTSAFDRATASLSGKLKDIGGSMTQMGKTMSMAVTLPVVAGFALMIKGASDMNETLNKVDVAFKDNAKEVRDWGNTTLKNIGLAKGTALDAAALFGDMATSMGLSTGESAKMSMSMVNLAGDLASFKNISIDMANTALKGIFTGETEAMKNLGIVMTVTNLEAYALSKGIKKSYESMSQAEKVNLRYAYVMSVTKNAQGDFARTFSGTANQMRYSAERVKELSAAMGAKLLPITGRLLEAFNKLLDKFSGLSSKQQDMIIKFLAIAAAMGPLLMIAGSLVTAIGAIVGVMASPIFWVFAAVIAAIGAAAFAAYKNWDKFQPVVETLKNAFMALKEAMTPFVRLIGDQLSAAWRDLERSFTRIKDAVMPFKGEIIAMAKILGGLLVGAIVITVTSLALLTAIVARLVGWVMQGVSWLAEKFYGAIEKVSGSTTQLQGFLTSLSTAFGGLGTSNDNARNATDRQRAAQDQLKTALTGVKDATTLLKDAQLQLEGSNLAVERAQRSYTEAVKQYGPGSLEAREALYGLKSAQDQQKTSADSAKTATDGYKVASQKLADQKQTIAEMRNVQAQTQNTGTEFDRQHGKPWAYRGAILGAFGGLGGTLWGAGYAVIQGLWHGMQDRWPAVANWLSARADDIKRLKGPIDKDKVMLVSEGMAIMQGLNRGMVTGYGAVQDTLRDITDNIGATKVMGQDNSSTTQFYGNVNINSKQDADYFFSRMNRQQEVTSLGLTPQGAI